MSLILHLSDLHLGTTPKDQVYDDYKSEIVPLSDRTTRISLLQNTLREIGLSLRSNGQVLDAIVITGDITLTNKEDGFVMLPALLGSLEDSCPPPNRIAVIPGNHDVTWGTLPSSSERYEHFLRHIRSRGYITPMLDGIDIGSGEEPDYTGHYILDFDQRYIILPINSCNYSGSIEPIGDLSEDDWNNLPAHLDAEKAEKARSILKKIRLHDVARISQIQLIAMRELLLQLNREIRGRGIDPSKMVRIALVHHHLLPVSPREEFKSFESITNLGLLRYFLLENNIDVVLHGHKHTGYTYWDHIYNPSRPEEVPPHRVLVISGSTIGGVDYREEEVCRLLDVKAVDYTPTIYLGRIPAVHTGGGLPTLDYCEFPLWVRNKEFQSSISDMKVIIGETVSEVYARVLSLFEKLPTNKELSNVACIVGRASTARTLPDGYPELDRVHTHVREKWFNDLVNWWQKERSQIRKPLFFTHGSRIYNYGGRVDQFQRAVNLLKEKRDTSRSIIVLLNPRTDYEIDEKRQKFPAFSLVQLIIREGGADRYQLDCIGYFRKQEVRYWWPVNITELSRLQEKAFNVLRDIHGGLTLGSLITVAAIAYAGRTPPKVAIPALDREFDENPNTIWSMTYALFWPGMPDRQDAARLWDEFLEDLIPAENPDPDGVPISVDGVKYLLELVSRFARHHPEMPAARLVRPLEQLFEQNDRYADDALADDPTIARHRHWRNSVMGIIQEIKGIISSALGT